jgi:two-component system, NtrC family, response regulator GlrR
MNLVSCGIAGSRELIGGTRAFQEAIRGIPAASNFDLIILIGGETGTGKELIARAIHYRSARDGKPFVPVNCGALPEHLFENEFFGHVRGASPTRKQPTTG